MKKLLLLIFSIITLFTSAQTTLKAYPDSFTVVQAHIDTFAVTGNDSIPSGDSVCITLLDSNSRFTVLGCTSIIYHPDWLFTGRDTVRYALCDSAMVCDTSMVVVWVDSDPRLLPVAGFKQDYTNPGDSMGEALFDCTTQPWGGAVYTLSSISTQSNSVSWTVRNIDWGTSLYNLTHVFSSDTIHFIPRTIWGNNLQFQVLEVCITAYNEFGSSTFCDTACRVYYEGITEVPLSHISLYPTPADRILTIDMQQNTDDISTHYTSIDLYNALGQKVRSIPHRDNTKIINVPVSSLPDGIYLATISDASGSERMLGKFTIAK